MMFGLLGRYTVSTCAPALCTIVIYFTTITELVLRAPFSHRWRAVHRVPGEGLCQ